eukprot:g17320.t1
MRRISAAPAAVAASLAAAALLFSSAEITVAFDWHNAGIGQNNLGRIAQACSSRHCGAGMNALDLWLSPEEVCVPVVPRALPQQVLLGSNAIKPPSSSAAGWSAAGAVAILAAVAVVGLFVGFRVGTQAAWRAERRNHGVDSMSGGLDTGVLIKYFPG